MPDLTQALLVPFVAGFIVQRFLDILDTFTTTKIADPNQKKLAMGVLSLVFGWLLAGFGHIRIFCALQWPGINAGWDIFFSGIFISAGTEGFNSVMKFANYKKEATKADAEDKATRVLAQQHALGNPQPKS
jgi:hypothetical protein